jgi:TRAP-type C4-dicarboxylate transport system substrate-binding protein
MSMFRRSFIATCAGTALALSAGAVMAAGKEVKLGYALPQTALWRRRQWLVAGHREVAGRQVQFKQFPASALGGERELIEGLQLGTVEAAIVSTGALSNFVPKWAWWTFPSCSVTRPMPVPCWTAFGQDLLAKFQQRGLVALAWGEQGFRHLTNNKHAVKRGRHEGPEDPRDGEPGAHHRLPHPGCIAHAHELA